MSSIKLQKIESLLKRVLPESLASLNDIELNSLVVLDVKCKRGKYDANIYLDPLNLTEDEQKRILKKLKKANSYIKTECLNATDWYRVPNFHYIFDNELERVSHIENLFKQISKELHGTRDRSDS